MPLGLLRVDFNDTDDDGLLDALIPLGSEPLRVGTVLHLLDDDGNYCIGTVVTATGRLVSLRLDWSKWLPEGNLQRPLGTQVSNGWTVRTRGDFTYRPSIAGGHQQLAGRPHWFIWTEGLD